jgi:hypothetical protein
MRVQRCASRLQKKQGSREIVVIPAFNLNGLAPGYRSWTSLGFRAQCVRSPT